MSLYREMAGVGMRKDESGMRKDESVQGDGRCWNEEG